MVGSSRSTNDARIVDPDGGAAIIPHAPNIGSDILSFRRCATSLLSARYSAATWNYGATGEYGRIPGPVPDPRSMPGFVSLLMPIRN